MAERVTDSIVTRRTVYHLGGYDPMPPQAVYRRFVREIRRFEGAWSLKAPVSEPQFETDLASWTIDTDGPNWHVATRFHFLRWDDVMAAMSARPRWWRVPHGFLSFLDFAIHGALWGYLRTSWRYAVFFLYPLLVSAALLGLAWGVGAAVASAAASPATGAAVGLCALVALVYTLGRRLFLSQLFDDWIFSRSYIRSAEPAVERRLDAIAQDISTAVRSGTTDEVLVVGHSLGAVLAVDLLDRALKLDPSLGCKGTALAFASVGSSILKIGLHRRATRFRAAVGRIADAPGLTWVEYQALTDPMNFYSSNPIAALGLASTGRPLVRKVWFKQMLDAPAYKRIRRNFFRLHNQFVSGNTKRASYDYFMLLCGPLAVRYQIALPDGFVSAFGGHAADGAVLGMPQPGTFIDDESVQLVPQ